MSSSSLLLPSAMTASAVLIAPAVGLVEGAVAGVSGGRRGLLVSEVRVQVFIPPSFMIVIVSTSMVSTW